MDDIGCYQYQDRHCPTFGSNSWLLGGDCFGIGNNFHSQIIWQPPALRHFLSQGLQETNMTLVVFHVAANVFCTCFPKMEMRVFLNSELQSYFVASFCYYFCQCFFITDSPLPQSIQCLYPCFGI
jgi:hypothetical protein